MQISFACFSTQNTNLAACVGALGIPVWGPNPADKCRNLDTGKETVTWNFELKSPTDDAITARWVEKWWRDRAQFERENPDHPMVWMRRGLDKYQWLTMLWHGNIRCGAPDFPDDFRTKDQILAACLMGHGIRLHSFDKPVFIFGKIHNEEFFEDYANFDFVRSNSTCWMAHAIRARLALLDILRDPRCKWRETRGSGSEGTFGLSIYEGTPDDQRQLLEDKYRELS